MQPNKRQELEERRRQLQIKHAADEFVTSSLEPYIEILEHLKKREVAFEVIRLMYLQHDWKPHLENLLNQAPYKSYGFHSAHVTCTELGVTMDQLYERYPSINPLRYVPALTKVERYRMAPTDQVQNGLAIAVTALALPDQKVFLYYLKYTPLIEIDLAELSRHADDELFNLWHGDAVIFPADLSWLIAFTLEEEWYAGRYEL